LLASPLRTFPSGRLLLARLPLERDRAVCRRVLGSAEAQTQVLADVASEKGGDAGTPVLPHVRELVREESGRFGRCRQNFRPGRAREKHAAAEDDRFDAGDCRQNPRERAVVDPCPGDLGG